MIKSDEIGCSLFGYDDGFKIYRTEGCIKNNPELNLDYILSLNLDKIQIRQTTHLFGCIKVFTKNDLYIFWLQYNTTVDYGRYAFQAAAFVTKNYKMDGEEIFNNLSALCSKNNSKKNLLELISINSLQSINTASLVSHPNKTAFDLLDQNHNADDFFNTVLYQPFNTVYACFEEIPVTDNVFLLNRNTLTLHNTDELLSRNAVTSKKVSEAIYPEAIKQQEKKSKTKNSVKKNEHVEFIASKAQSFFGRIYNFLPALLARRNVITGSKSNSLLRNAKNIPPEFVKIIEKQNRLKKMIEELESSNEFFHTKIQAIKFTASEIEELLEESNRSIDNSGLKEDYQEINDIDLDNKSMLMFGGSNESAFNPITIITIIAFFILSVTFVIFYAIRNYIW